MSNTFNIDKPTIIVLGRPVGSDTHQVMKPDDSMSMGFVEAKSVVPMSEYLALKEQFDALHHLWIHNE